MFLNSNSGVVVNNSSNINGSKKKEVTEREEELLDDYRTLSEPLQNYYYHSIKADAIKEKLKKDKN